MHNPLLDMTSQPANHYLPSKQAALSPTSAAWLFELSLDTALFQTPESRGAKARYIRCLPVLWQQTTPTNDYLPWPLVIVYGLGYVSRSKDLGYVQSRGLKPD